MTAIRAGVVDGTIRVPGSKSFTHRAYILAAQSDAPCTVRDPLRASDPDATLGCLHQLGAHIEFGDRHIAFQPAPLIPPRATLDCRNAGTGLRFLTALAARLNAPVTLTGDDSLQQRPNAPLLDALRGLGVHVRGQDRAPYTVTGPMRPGDVRLPAGISSQFGSALLLTLPMLDGPSTLRMEEPIASAPYLDITRACLGAFGIRTDGDSIPGGQVPRRGVFDVPADWSTAAFPLAAAAITGGRVRVVGPATDDPQGDKRILSILESFGAHVDAATNTVEGGDLHSPGTIDLQATPDLFPVLCAVAAVAEGTTTFTGGAVLRTKETDRIAAMAEGLQRMGITCKETPDGLIVTGGSPVGAQIAARHDHRIHMAFSVLGLVTKGKTHVQDPSSVAISYPDFHRDLAEVTT